MWHAVLDAVYGYYGGGIENDVAYRPRARGFVAYVQQLVRSVQFIDSVIDPQGTHAIADREAAGSFLRKLDQGQGYQNVRLVIDLREAARDSRESVQPARPSP